MFYEANLRTKTRGFVMLGKFNSYGVAKSFSDMTFKMSAIILGDDLKFWVVNLATMEKLLKSGYELAE